MLSLPQEVAGHVERLRSFIEQDLRPWEAEMARAAAGEAKEFRLRAAARSRELGFFGMTQPRRYGGTEAGPLLLTALHEELASANLRVLHRSVFGPGPGLLAGAEGQLATSVLEPLLRGEKSVALGVTEPADVPRFTQATWDGPEHLLVTGQKSYVTGGQSSDFVAVLLRIEEDGARPFGTTMVLVDRRAPGVTVERSFQTMDGEESHAFLRFSRVRVPSWQILSKVGDGMPKAMRAFGNMRLRMAATAVGLASWALRHTSAQLQRPHRKGSPLSSREGVQLRVGEMAIEVSAARALLRQAAASLEATKEGRPHAAATEVKMAKVFCTEACGRVVDTALQLAGGEAVVVGHPLERLYRAVRSLRLAEGPSDLLRLQIAEAALSATAAPAARL